MNKRKCIIYAVYHKPFIKPDADFVVPIHAGKAISNTDLPFIGDDTGENISALNPNFCELTVAYWIWKNIQFNPDDVWGLCHYRRYFVIPDRGLFAKKKSTIQKKLNSKSLNETVNDKLLQYIQTKLNSVDAIVQLPAYVRNKNGEITSLEDNYFQDHIARHWVITKEVLLKLYPAYAESLQELCKSTKLSFLNMMIANAAIWDGYLSWLFNILFEVKNRIDIPEDVYQARALGFISERLMTLYLTHNKIKVAYMPIVFFD